MTIDFNAPSPGDRRQKPRSKANSFANRQRFVFIVAGIIAVIFILINLQFLKIWTNYKATFGPTSQAQIWLNRKAVNYSLHTYDALNSILRLELACIRYSVNQTSLENLDAQRRQTIAMMDHFLPNSVLWKEMRMIESYDEALKDVLAFIEIVQEFEQAKVAVSEVTTSANKALSSWGLLKTESVEQEFSLRQEMDRTISAFRPVADGTVSIFLFLSILSVLFYVLGVYSVWRLLIIEHRRYRRFELLVASVGHDLRSPMQAIQSASSLLSNAISASERRKYSSIVNSSIKTLARLVDDIALAPQGKSHVLQLVYVDLEEWFLEFISLYQDNAAAKGLQLIPNIEVGKVLVEIDPERMTQSVGNLVDNAIKYTTKGTIWVRIRLRTQEDSDHKRQLVIKVKDTGAGINASDRVRIFRPFERAVPAGHEHEHGMGLGLSIVQRMAKSYGGAITVQSEVARCSLFKLTLPVRTRAKENSDIWQASTDPARLETAQLQAVLGAKEILVVDDDPNICAAVVGILHEAGFAIDTACNGNEALAKIAEDSYRVIITDIQMPGMNGFDLAKTVRSGNTLNPFLIAMTAYTTTLADDPRSKVFDGILSKPFDEEKLISLIEKAMESDANAPWQSDWGGFSS